MDTETRRERADPIQPARRTSFRSFWRKGSPPDRDALGHWRSRRERRRIAHAMWKAMRRPQQRQPGYSPIVEFANVNP